MNSTAEGNFRSGWSPAGEEHEWEVVGEVIA